jgi:hypothetical protein
MLPVSGLLSEKQYIVCCTLHCRVEDRDQELRMSNWSVWFLLKFSFLNSWNICSFSNFQYVVFRDLSRTQVDNVGWRRPLCMSHKVLIIRPNTTYRYSTLVFYYTLQHVLAVQVSHHQVDVGNRKKCKETVLWIATMLFQKRNNKIKTNS